MGKKHYILFSTFIIVLIMWNYWIPQARQVFNITRPLNVDFYAYYTAGRAYNDGLDFYKENYGSDVERKPGYSRYIYPPTMVPFFGLLAKFSYDAARKLWLLIYLSIYFATSLLVIYKFKKWEYFLINTLITILSSPLLFQIRLGQVDLIVTSLVVCSFMAYNCKHKWTSALLLTTAALIKVNPLLFLIYFIIFNRDISYFARYIISTAGVVLLSLPFTPLPLYVEYIIKVLPDISNGWNHFFNQSLIRFIANNSMLPQTASALGILCFAVIAWFLGKYKETYAFQEVVFCMNGLIILLFSGIAWHWTYVWTLIPLSMVIVKLIDYAQFKTVLFLVVGTILLQAQLVTLFSAANILGNIIVLGTLAIYLKTQISLSANSHNLVSRQEAVF